MNNNMLKGEKVYLRRLEQHDLDSTINWINNPEIFITMGLWGPRTQIEQQRWYERIAVSHTNIVFALCLSDTDQHIGNMSLFDIDLRNRNAGLTIIIPNEKFQGKGFGYEAVYLLCEYGFDYLNLNKIYCKTDNPHASKMYNKLGFVHEGTLRKQAYRFGKYVDKLIYGILRTEFVKIKY